MTIALMIIADGAVQTHVYRMSDGLRVSDWALARMGPGAYFEMVGAAATLDGGKYPYGVHAMGCDGNAMGAVVVAP